jgi:hypothetical protein
MVVRCLLAIGLLWLYHHADKLCGDRAGGVCNMGTGFDSGFFYLYYYFRY